MELRYKAKVKIVKGFYEGWEGELINWYYKTITGKTKIYAVKLSDDNIVTVAEEDIELKGE